MAAVHTVYNEPVITITLEWLFPSIYILIFFLRKYDGTSATLLSSKILYGFLRVVFVYNN